VFLNVYVLMDCHSVNLFKICAVLEILGYFLKLVLVILTLCRLESEMEF